MRIVRAFVTHELRMQARSLRFRVLAPLYAAGSIASVVAPRFSEGGAAGLAGPATYALSLDPTQPPLVAALAVALSIDGIQRERDEGSLRVVGLSLLSSAGYLLRRWLALVVVVAALSVLGPLTAIAASFAFGSPPTTLDPFLLPWLVHVLPVAVAATTVALALGTLAGGPIAALLLAGLIGVVTFQVVGGYAALAGWHLPMPAAWMGPSTLASSPWTEIQLANGGLAVVVSEQPLDPLAALGVSFGRGGFMLGLSAALLGVAVLYVRRSVPDMRAVRIPPRHAFRTYLGILNGVRVGLTPDLRVTAADAATVGGGLLALVVAVVAVHARDLRFRNAALRAYEAIVDQQPQPMPAGIAVQAWDLEASLDRRGRVASTSRARLANEGTGPAATLSFSLNPGLEVRSARAGGRDAVVRRTWDRLLLELPSPLAPGEATEVELAVEGVPREIAYGANELRYSPFLPAMRRIQREGGVDRLDLAGSSVSRLAHAGDVRLEGSDVFPVPRHAPWLIMESGKSDWRARVADEPIQAGVPFTVRFTGPPGIFLADTCGHWTDGQDGAAVLDGSCRQLLPDFHVVGGRRTVVSVEEGVACVAAFDAHAGRAAGHVPALALAAEVARASWPGRDPLGASVLVEANLTGEARVDPVSAGSRLLSVGRLVLVPEGVFAQPIPTEPAMIARVALLSDLLARREFAPPDAPFLEGLVQDLVLRQTGKGGSTAVIDLAESRREDATHALTGLDIEWRQRWKIRNGRRRHAVVAHLIEQAGQAAVVQAVEEFLAGGPAPGVASDAMERIERISGRDLRSLREQFIEGDALPVLTLDGVAVEAAAGSWRVSGRVRNEGTGEVECAVEVRAEIGRVATSVRVGGGAETPFTVDVSSPPRTLHLDPESACFRWRPRNSMGAIVGTVENVDLAKLVAHGR